MKCPFAKKQGDTDILPSRDRPQPAKETSCACKYVKWTLIVIGSLAISLFVIVFVILPLVVTFSIEVQTFLMFPNIDQPKNPQYTNYKLYDAKGTRNIYATVDDYYDSANKISLGIWHLVPDDLIDEADRNPAFDYDASLKTSGHPVVIYFHGNSGTRIQPLKSYNVLRKFFHVLAFDYRSYGDSTAATLSENAVVSDAMQLYAWVTRKTAAPIYVWGHSLGTALSTHTVANLRDRGLVPNGLFLEAPFTRMREEVPHHPIGKMFAWLPWFNVTIQDPLESNGFLFDTRVNILKVDCPIMIMHAEDDPVIPYAFGRTLYEIAKEQRDLAEQGDAFYYQFEAYLRHSHLQITEDPRVPGYIEKFLTYCQGLKEKRIRRHF